MGTHILPPQPIQRAAVFKGVNFELSFFVLLKGGETMRSAYIPKGEINHILAALTPPNRLACEISLATGLRINDVLNLKPSQMLKKRFTIHEEKTGKTRVVYLPKDLRTRALACSGQHFIFEGRLNGREHRTRQAVYKDLRQAVNRFGIKKQISPHSLRKIYAVEEFKKTGELKRVQRLLNHSSEAVTILYAMANVLDKKKNFRPL